MKIPNAPRELSPAARSWWRKLLTEYEVSDAAGLLLLEVALRAFDRMTEASALIAKHGAAPLDRWGQPKANPANAVERDARSALLQALKQLNFDVQLPPRSGGRPVFK